VTGAADGSPTDLEDRIVGYLRARLDAPDVRLTDVHRPSVGLSHQTWTFDAEWTRDGRTVSRGMCLRRDPGGTLLRHHSDLGTQFRVLECLARTPARTPEPYWFESDPEVLGAPFLVMERMPGVCPDPWDGEGRRFYREAAGRGELPGSFTAALAELHQLDWEAAGLGFLGVPEPGPGFAHRELAKWGELVELSGHGPEPVLTDLVRWLTDNAPSPRRLVLVHGAYRTGNLLIDGDRVSAVLDWELQAIGDPMFDVAYVLSDLNRTRTELLSNLVPRDRFYREYEAATGIEIDDAACRYYELLYAMRSVAFWMSAAGLYASGHSEDLRMARAAWSVPVVLDRAAAALGY
jgi:aminoglycoside phosphotransferase (APT) family kinase protein